MWRPRKVSQGTTDPEPIGSCEDRWGKSWKAGEKKSPMVVTVDKGGLERKWGPLSRSISWRAGCYNEETDREVKIFLEKEGKMDEVIVEKLVGKGGPRFWFKEKKPEPPQQQPEEKRTTSLSPKRLSTSPRRKNLQRKCRPPG